MRSNGLPSQKSRQATFRPRISRQLRGLLGCLPAFHSPSQGKLTYKKPETHVYSLQDILRLISVPPGAASTMVATAAFTGLRKSEIRGLLWENFRDDALRITQSVWERFVSESKVELSKSVILAITPLAQHLEKHRQALGGPTSAFIFVSARKGSQPGPFNLNSVLNSQINPKLKRAEFEWHRWHASVAASPQISTSSECRTRPRRPFFATQISRPR